MTAHTLPTPNAPAPQLPSAKRDTHTKIRKDGTVMVERFTLPRRFEHILVLLTFIALTATGLPQKFDGPYAQATMEFFGGLDMTRLIHRAAGLLFSVHATVHILIFVVGLLVGKMRWTMLPVIQDLRDARLTLLYYLGVVKRPPMLPKFDYKQKFEYLGMVLGGLLMVGSGLMLLFPQWFATYMPGELIPAARVAHSNEAMLALLVLVVWHVYGSHLSPEVFPMDTCVFTGYLTKEELRERHALEFRRLFPGEPVHGEEEPVAEQAAQAPAAEATAPPTAAAEAEPQLAAEAQAPAPAVAAVDPATPA